MTETGINNGDHSNGVGEVVTQERKRLVKRSASFTVNVEKVEVDPVIEYDTSNGVDKEHDDGSAPNGDFEADAVVENIIQGTDWESVNYEVKKFSCEDEVTGLAVSDDYIVTQYFMEPAIDVFDRSSLELLHRLEGHEYGGQAVQILGHVLYSGAKDRSFRSWDLTAGRLVSCVTHHRDYVTCLVVRS